MSQLKYEQPYFAAFPDNKLLADGAAAIKGAIAQRYDPAAEAQKNANDLAVFRAFVLPVDVAAAGYNIVTGQADLGDALSIVGVAPLGKVGKIIGTAVTGFRASSEVIEAGAKIAKAAPEVKSLLGILPRKGLTFFERNGVKIYGQTASSSTTVGHAESIKLLAEQLADSGKYAYITLQRSYRTATGRVALSRLIPDVIAVGKNGFQKSFEPVTTMHKYFRDAHPTTG